MEKACERTPHVIGLTRIVEHAPRYAGQASSAAAWGERSVRVIAWPRLTGGIYDL